MHLALPYLSPLWLVAVAVLPLPTQAVFLEFSALVVERTCTLSLNRSTLPLGDIPQSRLRPGQLVAQQPFVLSVKDCTGRPGGSLKPVVTVSGSGALHDGRWLFRGFGAHSATGVMVIQSDSEAEYSQPELRDGSIIALGNTGDVPRDQSFTFYAGASCGGNTGCAANTPGALTASVSFTFTYQ